MKRSLLITVDVEEWYDSEWFDISKITASPPSFCARDTDRVIDLFKSLNVEATFFVLGEIAKRSPSIIEKIVKADHEVACHAYEHFSPNSLGPIEFDNQIRKAKSVIEHVAGRKIIGFRSPNFSMTSDMIKLLQDARFKYDSSVIPSIKIPTWYGQPTAPLIPYRPNRPTSSKRNPDQDFWEMPIAVHPVLRFPGGGGWFLRNLGYPWTRMIVRSLLKRGPAVVYIHPWELSENNPKFAGIPAHVFRRTGKYVIDSIKSLVRSVEARPISIETFLEDL